MNVHYIGFHQLVQKLERITPISSVDLKVTMNNVTPIISSVQEQQNSHFKGVSSTVSNIIQNNINQSE